MRGNAAEKLDRFLGSLEEEPEREPDKRELLRFCNSLRVVLATMVDELDRLQSSVLLEDLDDVEEVPA